MGTRPSDQQNLVNGAGLVLVSLSMSLATLMSRLQGLTLVALVIVLITGLSSCAEYLPTAMGPLSGDVVALPNSWSSVADVEVIQLETLGDDGAYSVNLWIAEVDGALHVFAGDNYATWIQNMEREPEARLGVDGRIYELKGTRVTDPEVFERFAQTWEAKYGNRPRNENVEETYLIRLSPRT